MSIKQAKATYLADHPLCEDCIRCGMKGKAAHIHYIRPPLYHPELEDDPDNMIALCNPCYERALGRGSSI